LNEQKELLAIIFKWKRLGLQGDKHFERKEDKKNVNCRKQNSSQQKKNRVEKLRPRSKSQWKKLHVVLES